tara:strand:- start:3676 stop:4692 length:1017 start_codon:yes stop_codon:yes gene_type:complete
MKSLVLSKILNYKIDFEEYILIQDCISELELIRNEYYEWLTNFYNLQIENFREIHPEKFLNLRKFILDELLNILIDLIIFDTSTEIIIKYPFKHKIALCNGEEDINLSGTFCSKCNIKLSRDMNNYYCSNQECGCGIYFCGNCKGYIRFLPNSEIPIIDYKIYYKDVAEYKQIYQEMNQEPEKGQNIIYNLDDDTYYYTDEESDIEDEYKMNIKNESKFTEPELELLYSTKCALENPFNRYISHSNITPKEKDKFSTYNASIRFGINEEYDMQGVELFEFMVLIKEDGTKKIHDFTLTNFESLDSMVFELIEERMEFEFDKKNSDLYSESWTQSYKFK